MSYETHIDVVPVLRSTLYLLEHSQYPEKESRTVEALVLHLRQAIEDLETCKRLPASEVAADRRIESA
jgi:hypothetical protein